VQGDTTTAFISSLSAFYQKIPVGHIEAGLRSFNRDHPYPEEINRRLISVLSELHFAPTKQSSANLRCEGIDSTKIFLTGNTVVDSLLYITSRNDHTLAQYLPQGALNSYKTILVTCHRRENWGAPLENLCYGLQELVSSHSDIQILFPVHLNPIVRKTVFKILGPQGRVHLLDPLPYKAFIEAMAESHFIITDSGGVQEEGPSFNKPILVYRKVTERPEGVAAGCAKVIGLARENFLRETSRLLDDMQAYESMASTGNPYGDGRAAERIVQAIRHYFFGEDRPKDFIHRTNL
jgi:UDP-N-acetylglucosamine 2-epimerase (non-hydrolysing)